MPSQPVIFPAGAQYSGADSERTGLVLAWSGDGLPLVHWLGVLSSLGGTSAEIAAGVRACAGTREGLPLLIEHSRGSYSRSGLRGHRLAKPDGAGARFHLRLPVA